MGSVITLVGLGPGDPGMLSLDALDALTKSTCTWLRTGVHPVVEWLRENNIPFKTFDHIYREEQDFQEVYRRIAREVCDMARKGDVLYALPGHPLVAEESVYLIIEEAKVRGQKIRIIPGASFLDALLAVVKPDPAAGLCIVDGLRLDEQQPDPRGNTVVVQAYNRMVLSEIKLSLMDYYPDEHTVTAVTAAGVPGREIVAECPLYQLDRLIEANHLTSIYVPPLSGAPRSKAGSYLLDPLVEVMEILRSENGCPWDREQDHQSLKPYLLEEAYEVVDALNRQDMYNICEELGDLLLQIVFHAQIAAEEGNFDINDVIGAITQKMVRRHPHVFGDVKVENSREVMINWVAIKEREKPGRKKGILDGIPGNLAALMKAQEIQRRAAKVGFDWPDYKGALDKIYEELNELVEAVNGGNPEQMENETGDLIFAVVNLARLLRVDSETALVNTVNKFVRRFRYIEEKAALAGRKLTECTLEEMDSWWEDKKKMEKSIKK